VTNSGCVGVANKLGKLKKKNHQHMAWKLWKARAFKGPKPKELAGINYE